MKKKLGVVSLSILLAGASIMPAYAKAPHWADQYANWLTKQSVYMGQTSNDLDLEGGITNAEVIHAITSIISGEARAKINFSDVSSDKWYYDSISKAVAYGVVDKNLSIFIPDGQMPRAEVCKVLCKVYKFSPDPAYAESFSDVKNVQDELKGYIGALAKAGIIEGKGNRKFGPFDLLKRGEYARMLQQLITKYGYPQLKPVEVDKTKLNEAIKKAKELNTDRFTRTEYSYFMETLDKAKKLADDVNATKEQIDNMVAKLEEASNPYKINRPSSLPDYFNSIFDSRFDAYRSDVLSWLNSRRDYRSYQDWIDRGFSSFGKYIFSSKTDFSEYFSRDWYNYDGYFDRYQYIVDRYGVKGYYDRNTGYYYDQNGRKMYYDSKSDRFYYADGSVQGGYIVDRYGVKGYYDRNTGYYYDQNGRRMTYDSSSDTFYYVDGSGQGGYIVDRYGVRGYYDPSTGYYLDQYGRRMYYDSWSNTFQYVDGSWNSGDVIVDRNGVMGRLDYYTGNYIDQYGRQMYYDRSQNLFIYLGN